MNLKLNQKYEIIKEGSHLSGWEPIHGGYRGTKQELQLGDIITYLGGQNGMGSDPIPVDNFATDSFKGEFWPNSWGCADTSFLKKLN